MALVSTYAEWVRIKRIHNSERTEEERRKFFQELEEPPVLWVPPYLYEVFAGTGRTKMTGYCAEHIILDGAWVFRISTTNYKGSSYPPHYVFDFSKWDTPTKAEYSMFCNYCHQLYHQGWELPWVLFVGWDATIKWQNSKITKGFWSFATNYKMV